MLDRFTDRARKVMSMAKQEALDLHSNKVGTEHLLLALAKEDEGIAAEALRSLDIPSPVRRPRRPSSPLRRSSLA